MDRVKTFDFQTILVDNRDEHANIVTRDRSCSWVGALIDGHIDAEFPGNDPGEVPAMSLWQFYIVVTWYTSPQMRHR